MKTRQSILQELIIILLQNFAFDNFNFITNTDDYIQSCMVGYYDMEVNLAEIPKKMKELFNKAGFKIINIDRCDSLDDILKNNFNL